MTMSTHYIGDGCAGGHRPRVMSVADVTTRLAGIKEPRDDEEVPHRLEDQLWGDVLYSISLGLPNAQEVALEALKSKDIIIDRWYS